MSATDEPHPPTSRLTILRQQQGRLRDLRAQRLHILEDQRAANEQSGPADISALGKLDNEINLLESNLSSYITQHIRRP